MRIVPSPALFCVVAAWVILGLATVFSEERLLRAAFGAEFDEYARRVPAVIPVSLRRWS